MSSMAQSNVHRHYTRKRERSEIASQLKCDIPTQSYIPKRQAKNNKANTGPTYCASRMQINNENLAALETFDRQLPSSNAGQSVSSPNDQQMKISNANPLISSPKDQQIKLQLVSSPNDQEMQMNIKQQLDSSLNDQQMQMNNEHLIKTPFSIRQQIQMNNEYLVETPTNFERQTRINKTTSVLSPTCLNRQTESDKENPVKLSMFIDQQAQIKNVPSVVSPFFLNYHKQGDQITLSLQARNGKQYKPKIYKLVRLVKGQSDINNNNEVPNKSHQETKIKKIPLFFYPAVVPNQSYREAPITNTGLPPASYPAEVHSQSQQENSITKKRPPSLPYSAERFRPSIRVRLLKPSKVSDSESNLQQSAASSDKFIKLNSFNGIPPLYPAEVPSQSQQENSITKMSPPPQYSAERVLPRIRVRIPQASKVPDSELTVEQKVACCDQFFKLNTFNGFEDFKGFVRDILSEDDFYGSVRRLFP